MIAISIKEIVKQELQRRGISATKFAESIGMRKASLTEFLAGRKELNSDNIERICNALELTIERIISSDETDNVDDSSVCV